MRERISLEKGRFYVIESDWSTKGAQEFPLWVVVDDRERVLSVLNESSVFYVGGPLGDEIVGFWTR